MYLHIRTTIDYLTRAPKTFIIKLFSSIEGYDYKEIRQMPLFLRGRLEKTQIFVVRVHAIQPNHGSDLSKKFPKITDPI